MGRVALTHEANEDQVEVPGVNDQCDRHVPEYFASKKTVDKNQRASTNDPHGIGIPIFFLYSLQVHGISNIDTLEHNRS
jgi:hypothetical protein